MPLFKKKKSKEEEIAERVKAQQEEEIQAVIKARELEFPTSQKAMEAVSSDYAQFLKELQIKPRTFYEKLCAQAEKILKIKLDEKTRRSLQEKIDTSYLSVTPEGVISLSILTLIFGILILLLNFIIFQFDTVFFIFGIALFGGLAYYIYTFPEYYSRVVLLQMSSETVLAILYMIIYMRTNPNLDGAIKFAAQNLPGALGYDLKKLVWDIEVGTYASTDIAVAAYISKWKEINAEFAEALHILRSVAVEPARRELIFHEAMNTILNGTRERSRHYAAGLRMPMMIIDAMGILLPVMGLVLFPIVMLFMADAVKPSFLAFGYDVLLPIGLFIVTTHVLSTRPPTFSAPELSKLKGVPPLGKMRIGKEIVPIWPIAFLFFAPFLIIFLLFGGADNIFIAVTSSAIFILGIALAIGIYCYLDSSQKIAARKAIERIEDEFSVALFQLGNAISGGASLEVALQKTIENTKNLKINEMFVAILTNMQRFGYTFEQAVFDKEIGAIWYYPSRLIESIMHTVIESSKKSISSAAESMMSISEYLKSVHEVKEEINDMLGETVSSMKFLSTFLAPMIAGVTLTMAVITIRILIRIKEIIPALGLEGSTGMAGGFSLPLGLQAGMLPITPVQFQLVIGFYVIILMVLLGKFINDIQCGEDPIGARSMIAWILIFGATIYLMSWIATYSMFGNSIEALLSPL